MEKILQNGIRWIAAIAIVLGMLAGVNTVRADVVLCAADCNSTALTAAITSASAGDVIEVPAGTHVLDTVVTVNKAVTIHGAGAGSTIFQVSGTGYRFQLTAPGATLENFEIDKTDKTGVQNIIGLLANNVTVQNLTIHGRYVQGDPEVSRAMESAGGLTGIKILNNTIYGLRQPAYLNASEITITGNSVRGTRGWVLANTNATFTGNTWGTAGQWNAVDIAIFAGTNPAYYTDLMALSAANNGAVIEDQRSGVLTHVWVDDSSTATKDFGYRIAPYPSLQAGIDRAVAGGNVYVAAGTYIENGSTDANLVINKSVNLYGVGKDLAGNHQTIVQMASEKAYAMLVNGTNASVSINRMSFVPAPGIDYGTNYGIYFGSLSGNFTNILINDVSVERAKTTNLRLDNKSTYGSVVIEDTDVIGAGVYGAHILENSIIGSLEVARSNITDNGISGESTGGGLVINTNLPSAKIYDSDFSRNLKTGITVNGINNPQASLISRIKVNGTRVATESAGIHLSPVGGKTVQNVNINNSEFRNNAGAAIRLSSDATSSIFNLTIVSNLFEANGGPAVATGIGGSMTDIKIHHNSILTDGVAILDEDPDHVILADNNWYGCNEGPDQPGCGTVSLMVPPTKWLVLKAGWENANLLPGSSTEIAANLNFNNFNEDTTVPPRGTFPNGIPVSFTATVGAVTPTSGITAGGLAKVSYLAPSSDGPAEVCATLDNEEVCANAVVTNVAPVAVNDAYTMNQMEVLTVAAEGVLTNDTDENGNLLTAVLVTSPEHGTLTLNADGSFTYTPVRFWWGTDSFTYKANDGTNDSAAATVTITVQGLYTETIFLPVLQR